MKSDTEIIEVISTFDFYEVVEKNGLLPGVVCGFLVRINENGRIIACSETQERFRWQAERHHAMFNDQYKYTSNYLDCINDYVIDISEMRLVSNFSDFSFQKIITSEETRYKKGNGEFNLRICFFGKFGNRNIVTIKKGPYGRETLCNMSTFKGYSDYDLVRALSINMMDKVNER